MESKIRVLSEHTINQIAAGEVIENPASVVKELVENAIDAEASEISVEIVGGGRNLIRISDNGFGMSADDAVLCLERHATSKIKNVDDIQKILTMGFRGEAIPSIASISKFSILTCPKDQEIGTLVIVDGGRILKCEKAPRSHGTTMEVKSLFYNVPVRRKFQKSPNIDANEILKMLSMISLGNPNIKFELISNEKTTLVTPKTLNGTTLENLKNRIKSILGSDFIESSFPVSGTLDGIQVEGFIGCTSMTRQNRTGQYLFINQRAVQNPYISYAVRDAYGTALSSNRHPIYVLHLTIPGDLVDVNVHPQKKEVRLRQEQALKDLIIKSVEQALQKSSFSFEQDTVNAYPYPQYQAVTPQFSVNEKYQMSQYQNLIQEAKDENNYCYTYQAKNEWPEKLTLEPQTNSPIQNSLEVQPHLFSNETSLLTVNVIATIPHFILVDPTPLKSTGGFSATEAAIFCLVDQKAAHTRIIFEKLLENKNISIQTLLIPYVFETTVTTGFQILDQIDFLCKMGIQIYQSGPNTFTVDSIPDFFGNSDVQTFLEDLINQLSEFQNSDLVEKEKEKRLAISAARASISDNKRLSFDEAKNLVNQLMKCKSPFQCPRGKPIFASLTKNDLQNFF